MLTLNDGRKELYQWDSGRTATVDIECDVVHFANLKYGESLAVEVKAGKVAIPNKLLMSGEPIYCWAFVKDENGAYTKKEQTFVVTKRAKPSDYVYTETDVITVKTAVDKALQEAKESGDFKGEKGETGATGPAGKDGVNGKDGVDGKDGTSVTVSNVSESTEDGGNNVVTFSDGKTLTVKNGSKGSQGKKGDPTDVWQTTGQSTTAVMSQKAVTDNFELLQMDISGKLPKSPTDWEPWTAEEKEAAQNRIGISGHYEMIEEIVLTDEIFEIIRDTDTTGKQYSLQNLLLLVSAGVTTLKMILQIYINGERIIDTEAIGDTDYGFGYVCKFGINKGILYTFILGNRGDFSNRKSSMSSIKGMTSIFDKIKSLKIKISNPIEGATIKIYGVRV